MRKPPKKLTVLVDSREKYRMLFPGVLEWYPNRASKPVLIPVKQKMVTLLAGDYTLEGFDDVSGVETKRGVQEVHQNMLTKDYSRAEQALQKLVEGYEHPYLLFECPVGDLYKPTQWAPNPARSMQHLLRLCTEKGIQLLFAGTPKSASSRRLLGEFVLTVMLTHALREECGPIDIFGIMEQHVPNKEENE